MKTTKIYLMGLVAVLLALTSCRGEDDLTESIFDTDIPAVDTSKTTAEFDQWLYDHFVEPYNTEIQYRFNLPASDYSFQLTPSDYNRSQLLANFILHLFYDVYTKYAGEDFMKQYGPRIFHFIGSSGYSPTTGTEILGLASGGVKITLYKINEMKPWSPNVVYSTNDIETLNENYFHTMHHEFSHILHQTKTYPVVFGQQTSATYDPIDWQERDSVASHQLGYVTHYASSASYEDFVETLSCIITDSKLRWMRRIINASAPGIRADEKAKVLELIDSLDINPDDPTAHWNNFTLYDESEYNAETGVYDPTDRIVLDVHRNLTDEVINKSVTAYVRQYRYTERKKYTSFRDFLDGLQAPASDEVSGISALLSKISIATEWHDERWGLKTFTLRREVQERQNTINDYLRNEVTIFDLK